MKMNALLAGVVASLFFAAVPARAAYVDIDLAGWTADGAYDDPDNSSISVDIGAFSYVWDFEWIGLEFHTHGFAQLNEIFLSVNSSDLMEFMDWAPSNVPSHGSYGPASGSFGSTLGGGMGLPFSVLEDGILIVMIYNDIPMPVNPDVTVTQGTLRVYYDAVVPEPTTFGLLALGGCAVFFRSRRRR